MQFVCSKCGECCRHIKGIPELSDFDNGEGVCINLVGNICSIYEIRPEICDVKKMYEKYFSLTITEEAFFEMNYKICKKLQTNSL